MLRQCFGRFAIGLLFIACIVCRTAAEDESPTPGKSKIVAAPSLKKVETFRRKVVFFTKDVDLPCLRLPAPDEQTLGFVFTTGLIKLLASQPYSQHVEMTNDGDLVFRGHQTIFRVNKKGKAEKLADLAELTLTGAKAARENLHFDSLLGASPTAAVLYLGLSNENAKAGVPFSPRDYSYYLGKLDIPARKLSLLSYDDFTHTVILDAEAGTFYQVRAAIAEPREVNGKTEYELHEGFIRCRDFNGKTLGQWPMPEGFESAVLSPDKQAMLLIPLAPPDVDSPFSLLDLKSGDQTELPISGRAAAWGAKQTLYYLEEKAGDDGVLNTSLFRFRIGKKRPTRLFLVSCKRVRMKDSSLGMVPRLSADRSWLAWHLPVEDFHESGTILLDVANGEYRIMKGSWEGVQWDPVGSAFDR